ncbi:MAG: hypothetical protein AB9Q17_02370 [Candidatus Reddybacter sp.]
MPENVAQRIAKLVAIAPEPLSEAQAVAARRLYSTLAQLEYIAVLAAERGDCVEGQLEDELVHRGVFMQLAQQLGGVCVANAETRALVAKLEAMRGPQSLLLLNIVAETWLETVFDELAKPGWGSELFAAVEADEARHVAGAWAAEIPDAEELLDDLSAIEHALANIALSLAFILPIRHLRGDRFCGDMGLAAINSHERVCARLGVTPGKVIGKLKSFSRGIRMLPQPGKVNPTAGRLSLMRASPVPFVMDSIIEVPNRFRLPLAAVVKAASQLLHDHPELRRVMRGDTLYQHKQPSVFVRVKMETGIRSVWLRNPGKYSPRQIYRQIKKQRARLAQRKHYPLPALGEMEPLLPPAQAALAVTDISQWRFDNGTTPLVPAEGVPIVITLGTVTPDKITVAFSMDHRVFDAADMGLVKNGLLKYLVA